MSADLFQKLPPEIIIAIAKTTADFVGIDSLLNASTWVRDVISHSLFEVTEDLLASFPITGNSSEILFLITCLVNKPGFKCSDFDDLQSNFTELSLRDFSDKTIYGTLRKGAHIQRLACACITKFRENLITGLEAVMDANWEKTLFHDWRQHMTAEASWVEEFRVYRALWCLQILSDIYHASGSVASHNGCGGWGWASAEREKLPSFGWSLPTKFNEPNSVAEILLDLGASCIIPSDVPIDHVVLGFPSPKYLYPIFESLRVKDLQRFAVWTPPSPPGKTMFGNPKNQWLEAQWARHPASLRGSQRSGKWALLYEQQRRSKREYREQCPSRRQYPPLRNVRALHRMGVFIWDDWRLVCVGLVEAMNNDVKFPAPDFSRWFEPTPHGAIHRESPHLERWTALVETKSLNHRG